MKGVLTLVLMLVSAPVLADLEFDEWELRTDRDGIRVYMAHDDDARIKTFRGVTELEVDDFSSFFSQMDDYEFVASWMHMVSEISELGREDEMNRSLYVTTRLPWPVSNRDAPLRITFEQDPDDYSFHVRYRDEQDAKEEQSGYVRMPQMQGNLTAVPLEPGKVEMRFKVVVDPGGYIPAWLANMILREIPYFSLQRYRRVVNRPEYQGTEHDTFRVPPGWPGYEEQQERLGKAGD